MNNKYPWKQAIITGTVVGIFAIASFSIADRLNRHLAWGMHTTTLRGLTGLLTLVILAVGIYTGMRSVKRNNSGKLSYGHAMLTGFIIALITGIITALAGLIYCQYINPGYGAYMLSESIKEMTADGKSPAEIAAGLPGLKQQWSTGGQMMQALMGQTACGTVISLILGLFIKSKK
jgi:hypothetical protein